MRSSRHRRRNDLRGWTTATTAAVFFAAAGLGGCGDEATHGTTAGNQARTAVDSDAPHKVKWLETSSPLSPAQWLVSKRDDELKPIGNADVQMVAERLAVANARYRESERMVANRAAQLSDMLASHGITEDPIAILDDLTSIAGEVGQTEGFGAISQHYFNLRIANIERGEALAALKTRYGPRH